MTALVAPLITLAVLVAAYAAWRFARKILLLPVLALILSGVAWHTVSAFPWQGCQSVFSQGTCTAMYVVTRGVGDGLVGFQAWVQKEANGGNGK